MKRNYRRRQSDNLRTVSTETGNIPPQAIEVEAAVLGAMMMHPESVDSAIEVLNEKSFYDIKHRRIFEAMHELYSERTPMRYNGDLVRFEDATPYNPFNDFSQNDFVQ